MNQLLGQLRTTCGNGTVSPPPHSIVKAITLQKNLEDVVTFGKQIFKGDVRPKKQQPINFFSGKIPDIQNTNSY